MTRINRAPYSGCQMSRLASMWVLAVAMPLLFFISFGSAHEIKTLGSTQEMKTLQDTQEVKPSGDTQEVNISDDAHEIETSEETQEETLEDTQEIETSKEIQEEETLEDTQEIETSKEIQEEETLEDTKEIETSEDTQEEETLEDTLAVNISEDAREVNPLEDTKEDKPSANTQEIETSEDTKAENPSGDTQKVKTSGDTQEEKASEDTKEENPSENTKEDKPSENTQEMETSEDTQDEKTSKNTLAVKTPKFKRRRRRNGYARLQTLEAIMDFRNEIGKNNSVKSKADFPAIEFGDGKSTKELLAERKANLKKAQACSLFQVVPGFLSLGASLAILGLMINDFRISRNPIEASLQTDWHTQKKFVLVCAFMSIDILSGISLHTLKKLTKKYRSAAAKQGLAILHKDLFHKYCRSRKVKKPSKLSKRHSSTTP
eukprot:GHVT01080257.1.p1 GENE.GHVT01080257.1~~GHVT01080257.1.p1  ORF type:complete len:433 (+),score=56.53 GHVT01080257.1:300-1598(+)